MEWEKGREFECSLVASIQATLHNQNWKRDDGKPWTAAMFMPGYAPPKQTWQEQLQRARLRQQLGKKPDLKKRREAAQQQTIAKTDFANRQAKADEARKRGAGRDEIRAIMEGN